jgi:hypothetical protein
MHGLKVMVTGRRKVVHVHNMMACGGGGGGGGDRAPNILSLDVE